MESALVEPRLLQVVQCLTAQDVGRVLGTSQRWNIAEPAWASVLWRDFSERAPRGVSAASWCRSIKQWRADAELSIDSIARLPDADATLAYMVRNAYYPVKLDKERSWLPEMHHHQDVLRVATQKGFTDACRALVEKGVCLSSFVYVGGVQPLHTACRAGHLSFVRLLTLEVEGIDVNAQGENRATPLHYACAGDRLEVVRFLLSEVGGVDIGARNALGQTPFCVACEAGCLDVVRFLAGHPGVDVNRPDDYRKTPLYMASYRGKLEVVRFLLALGGVDVNAADQHNSTPHSIACRYAEVHKGEYSDIVALLESVEGLTRDASDYPGMRRGRGRGGRRGGRG